MTDRFPFLGRGWAFPPKFDRGGGQVAMVEGFVDVHESVQVILNTIPGERVMRPGFGCDLHSVQFEEVTPDLSTRIKRLVTDSLLYHEPRIEVETVNLREDTTTEGLLYIELTYRIRAVNSRFNMVFPFYLQEATP